MFGAIFDWDGVIVDSSQCHRTAWEELGASSASGRGLTPVAGSSRSPSLTVDSTGRPAIAWELSSGGRLETCFRCRRKLPFGQAVNAVIFDNIDEG